MSVFIMAVLITYIIPISVLIIYIFPDTWGIKILYGLPITCIMFAQLYTVYKERQGGINNGRNIKRVRGQDYRIK